MKEKSAKRIENKRKKMASLLQLTSLNERDRSLKNIHKNETNNSSMELEPSVKKLKTENGNCLVGDENNGINEENCVEIGPSGKPLLSGYEFQELKKMLRERTTKLRQQPIFRLREMGENACLRTDLDNRVPLFLSDVQHLIMYSQIGHHSPYSPARWCNLERFNRLSTTCVLVIENISLYNFIANENMFPFLSSTMDHKVEILAPNSYNRDVVKELSMVPLTGTQMRKFCDEFGTLQDAVLKSTEIFDTLRNLFPIETEENPIVPFPLDLPSTDKYARTQLLLSGWQMVEENFPLPIKGLMEHKYPNYVLTKDHYQDVTPSSKMYGIDCEMCKTTTGELELTRVSVVDESCNIFYDTLVKPANKITDYLTRFSGITHKMMKNTTTNIQKVQEDLRRLLPDDAILVGQSLANDLHALKMMHPYVIDTSVIFNLTGVRTRKTKLKTLAQEFLSERIQEGRSGHCSTEDSSAALKLTQLKLTKSLYFGDAVMGKISNDVGKYPDLGTYNFATSMLKQTTRMDKTASIVAMDNNDARYRFYVNKGEDSSDGTNNRKIQYFSENNCKDVIQKISTSMNSSSLNIGHIRIQDSQLESTKIFKKIDKWTKTVYDTIQNAGLYIVIFTGKEASNGGCFIKLKNDIK